MAFDVILRHRSAAVVQDAEIELRSGVPLIGGLAIPLRRLGRVLLHAAPFVVHDPQTKLSACAVLIGGRAEPPPRLRIVLRRALTALGPATEAVLRGGEASDCGLAEPFAGL